MRACFVLLMVVALTGCAEPGSYRYVAQETCDEVGGRRVNCRDTSYTAFTPEPSQEAVYEPPFRGPDIPGGMRSPSGVIGHLGGFTSKGVRPSGGDYYYDYRKRRQTIHE